LIFFSILGLDGVVRATTGCMRNVFAIGSRIHGQGVSLLFLALQRAYARAGAGGSIASIWAGAFWSGLNMGG